MQVITLTTDLGLKDFYVGIVKGNLLQTIPSAKIIDLSHEIKPFNILEAAFVLKNAYKQFPKGTIHIVSVDTSNKGRSKTIAFEYESYYFIGPDNGLFSLVFDGHPSHIVRLDVGEEESTFILKNVMIPAAAKLVQGLALSDIGKPIHNMEVKSMIQPTLIGSRITGSIIYVDHYGNVVTNIHKTMLNGHLEEGIEIFFHRDVIDEISKDYYEVPSGEKLCLINNAGYLEIAINQGNAHLLLGLNLNDSVQLILK